MEQEIKEFVEGNEVDALFFKKGYDRYNALPDIEKTVSRKAIPSYYNRDAYLGVFLGTTAMTGMLAATGKGTDEVYAMLQAIQFRVCYIVHNMAIVDKNWIIEQIHEIDKELQRGISGTVI
jgi:hypothetical protein